ncbi:MAG: hypothetical protein M3033_12320 [Acidobacteriota bacterium]|nr:hypothetical protein [Acidobacteriota bacterium]
MDENFYNPNPPRKIIIRRYLSEGIYQVKRKSVYPLIEHYGVAIVGKHLEELRFTDGKSRVFHKTNLGIHIDFFNVNEWKTLKFVPANQVKLEIARLKIALKNQQKYSLLDNCEHFSQFVMEGIAQSTQVQNVVVVGSLAALFLLSND